MTVLSVLDRIARGPVEPPTGVAYSPAPTVRCLLGLHRWAEVWSAFPVEQSTDGLGHHRAVLAFNLDRPADYETCIRCDAMRHREPEPRP